MNEKTENQRKFSEKFKAQMVSKFQPTKEELFEIWRMSMNKQVSENEAVTKFKKVNGKLVHIWE